MAHRGSSVGQDRIARHPAKEEDERISDAYVEDGLFYIGWLACFHEACVELVLHRHRVIGCGALDAKQPVRVLARSVPANYANSDSWNALAT